MNQVPIPENLLKAWKETEGNRQLIAEKISDFLDEEYGSTTIFQYNLVYVYNARVLFGDERKYDDRMKYDHQLKLRFFTEDAITGSREGVYRLTYIVNGRGVTYSNEDLKKVIPDGLGPANTEGVINHLVGNLMLAKPYSFNSFKYTVAVGNRPPCENCGLYHKIHEVHFCQNCEEQITAHSYDNYNQQCFDCNRGNTPQNLQEDARINSLAAKFMAG